MLLDYVGKFLKIPDVGIKKSAIIQEGTLVSEMSLNSSEEKAVEQIHSQVWPLQGEVQVGGPRTALPILAVLY